MESLLVPSAYKFGVLYCKDGQKTEEEMFSNKFENCSDLFKQFLLFLGDYVTLKGFTGFRGGLDIKSDACGPQSIYTKFSGVEVMFHVAPLLPHNENDVQHVEKKRHIGNDIIVIVFNDSSRPFSPLTIKSEFNHIYAVIQPVAEAEEGKTCYRLGFASKTGVPPFSPLLPIPSIFQLTAGFREFFFTKLFNGERAACTSPDFGFRLARTRAAMLEDMAKRYLAKKATRGSKILSLSSH